MKIWVNPEEADWVEILSEIAAKDADAAIEEAARCLALYSKESDPEIVTLDDDGALIFEWSSGAAPSDGPDAQP